MTTPPPPPPVTQCYKCQGFNHVAKDCKNVQKCVRCAGGHKCTECPDKDKESLKLKCSNCDGDHIASFRKCPKFKVQIKIQADRAKARQEKLQNNLVVRGITFSNMVQNKIEKVQSELTEKGDRTRIRQYCPKTRVQSKRVLQSSQ